MLIRFRASVRPVALRALVPLSLVNQGYKPTSLAKCASANITPPSPGFIRFISGVTWVFWTPTCVSLCFFPFKTHPESPHPCPPASPGTCQVVVADRAVFETTDAERICVQPEPRCQPTDLLIYGSVLSLGNLLLGGV